MTNPDFKFFDSTVVEHAFDDKDELIKADLENLGRKIKWVQLEHPQAVREAEIFLAQDSLVDREVLKIAGVLRQEACPFGVPQGVPYDKLFEARTHLEILKIFQEVVHIEEGVGAYCLHFE